MRTSDGPRCTRSPGRTSRETSLTLLGRDFQPLTVGLANLQSPHLAQDDLVSAGAMMAILPPLLLFVALNRYYVRGLFAGSER